MFNLLDNGFNFLFSIPCYFYYLSSLLCLGFKREIGQNEVTPKHIKHKSSLSGTYLIFPSKALTVCSEKVGYFNSTYAIFRHIFAQMGAFINIIMNWLSSMSCLTWIILVHKTAYSFACQTAKKPPDPFNRCRSVLIKLIIILMSSSRQCMFSINTHPLQRDVRPSIGHLDPSLLSNESFMKLVCI